MLHEREKHYIHTSVDLILSLYAIFISNHSIFVKAINILMKFKLNETTEHQINSINVNARNTVDTGKRIAPPYTKSNY